MGLILANTFNRQLENVRKAMSDFEEEMQQRDTNINRTAAIARLDTLIHKAHIASAELGKPIHRED